MPAKPENAMPVLSKTFKSTVSAFIVSCLLLTVSCFSSAPKALPEQPEYLVKSAMIFKMLQYITWPDENKLAAIRLAFVGDEDQLYEEMLRASKNIRVKGKPLIVFKTDIHSIAPHVNQVVYLDAKHSADLRQVAQATRRTGTLLLTNQAKDRHELMINFLSSKKDVLSFEVNRSNILFEQLKIDNDLMLLGGTEIDVAELFRETEQALQQIKQDLFEREMKLDQTNQTLKNEQAQIEKQQDQIQRYKNDIKQREQQLETRARDLKKLDVEIHRVNGELLDRQQELTAKESRYNEQLKRLKDQAVKVAFLNEQIVEKQAVLAELQEKLQTLSGKNDKQQGDILSQKKVLYILYGVLVVFTLLISYSLWLNIYRRRSNRRLARYQADLTTLSELGRDLTANLDLKQVIEKVNHSLDAVLDAEVMLLGIVDREKARIDLPLVVESGKKAPPLQLSLNDDSHPLVYCVKQREQVLLSDELQWAERFNEADRARGIGRAMTTALFIPLDIGNKVVGCLSLQSPVANAYSQQQIDMIHILSRYITVALSNALGYAELQRQKHKSQSQDSRVQVVQQQLLQSEKMATLGMLTNGIAHAINDPANFTHTAAYLLQQQAQELDERLSDSSIRDAIGDDLSKLIELAQSAQEGSKRIKSVIDTVRRYTDMTDGKHLLPLPQLVETAIDMIRTQHSQVAIGADGHHALGELKFPPKLSRMLLNLLLNACRAVEKRQHKDPRLNGQVTMRCRCEDEQLMIDIEDNGSGMESTTKDRLFEAFHTADSGSSGLGITLSNEIVKELGGTLEVVNTSPSGSRLSIRLPVGQ